MERLGGANLQMRGDICSGKSAQNLLHPHACDCQGELCTCSKMDFAPPDQRIVDSIAAVTLTLPVLSAAILPAVAEHDR